MPTEVTPLSALVILALFILIRIGWDLGGCVVSFVKTGVARGGELVALLIVVILILVVLVRL